MKLIIFDFDGPINNLTKAKKDIIDKISKELSLEWSEKNSWELINYIDQIYELEKTYEYSEIISKSLNKMVKNKLTNLSDVPYLV